MSKGRGRPSLYGPNNATQSIRMPKTLFEGLSKEAASLSTSFNQLAVKILADYFSGDERARSKDLRLELTQLKKQLKDIRGVLDRRTV